MAGLGEGDRAEQLGDVGQTLVVGLLGEDRVLLGRLALAGEGGLEVRLVHRVQVLGLREPALEVLGCHAVLLVVGRSRLRTW